MYRKEKHTGTKKMTNEEIQAALDDVKLGTAEYLELVDRVVEAEDADDEPSIHDREDELLNL